MEMRTKAKGMEDIFPLMSICDGFVISKRGDITLGWEVTLPGLFSLTEKEHDDLISSFASAVGLLDPWMMVHRQDIFLHQEYERSDAKGFLSESFERHFDNRTHLIHRQFLFLTITSKESACKGVSSSGLFGIKAPSGEALKSSASRLQSKAEEFASVLGGKGYIHLERLTDHTLLEIIGTHMRLGGRQTAMLSDFEMFPDRVSNADKSLWAFSISNSSSLPSLLEPSRKVDSLSGPAAQLHSSFGSAIGPLMDCEHAINSYILTLPQGETLSEMDARRRRMVSMSRNAENKNNAEQLEAYIDEVHKEKLITVKTHTNILVWDSHDNLQQVKGRVSAALAGIGISCVQDIYDTPVLWYSALPGAECELGSENLMLMELGSALCLGVNESFETGLPGGLLKLCDRTRNIPLEIDIQRKAHEAGLIDNYNAFILGGSGTGKSFFTNFFVRSCYDAGQTVFIIDVGDSYEGLCAVIREESEGKDGIYHTWDMNNPLSFDAFLDFEQWTDLSGTLRQDSDGLNFLLSFLQTLWSPQGGWSADTSNILKQMIRDFRISWNRSQRPIFDDFRNFLIEVIMPKMESDEGYLCGEIRVVSSRFDISGFVLAMGDYASGGAFGFLLNDKSPKDLFSSRFTVFEVEKLASVNDSKFYSLCILCIMNSFNAKMRSQDGMKVMVIEEAWKAIANETMAPYLTGLWKTARKYSTSAVVVTQQITDIMSSSVINDTILQNSSVRILLDQSNNLNNFDQIKTLLGLSDHQKAMVLSMNRNNNPRYRYREVFIALGDRQCGVYATEVSPQEAVAYESSKEKKKPFLNLQQKIGTIAAIKELTQKKS